MSTAKKDTIYIDVDDEITSIIDKVRSSGSGIVALVLPKRANVFHSIVNMRLLKRSADEAKKKIVLITSESGVMPLAGMAGIHVAKTPQSKPAIPAAPQENDAPIDTNEDIADKKIDKNAPIGVLAGIPNDNEEESIEVDNSSGEAAAAASVAKKEKGSKFKIPNFEKFRTRLFLGVAALVLLIVGWVFAAIVLPKAKITIKTDTTDVASNLTLTASPKAQELDKEKKIVPAITKEFKKTENTKVPATGEKDGGTKANGEVSLKNCTASVNSVTVPAGTGVSTAGLTFITQEEVTLPATSLNGLSQCTTPTKDVSVLAQNAGDKYNLSENRSFTVSGYSNITGVNEDPFNGGTTKIIKIVNQSDVDGAKQKILDDNLQTSKGELSKLLKTDGYLPITDTHSSGNPTISASPKVGDEGSEVNVNVIVIYTMMGAKEESLKELVEEDINKNIDSSKQSILDNGLGQAVLQVIDKPASGDVKFTLQAQAKAGVAQNEEDIKKSVAGKKRGETQEIIQQRPGVKDVTVNYSPFWVFKTPSKQNKITIIFEQSNTDANKPE